jgi:hypothetical protein
LPWEISPREYQKIAAARRISRGSREGHSGLPRQDRQNGKATRSILIKPTGVIGRLILVSAGGGGLRGETWLPPIGARKRDRSLGRSTACQAAEAPCRLLAIDLRGGAGVTWPSIAGSSVRSSARSPCGPGGCTSRRRACGPRCRCSAGSGVWRRGRSRRRVTPPVRRGGEFRRHHRHLGRNWPRRDPGRAAVRCVHVFPSTRPCHQLHPSTPDRAGRDRLPAERGERVQSGHGGGHDPHTGIEASGREGR